MINLISIGLLIMPYFTFVRRWIMDFEFKFGICYWWWQFEWSEGWTPDSITRVGWEVNIKSMQEEEFPKMWVGSLINCCRPNCEVTASILEPSYVVLSCLYQFEDLLSKSLRATVSNGFWLLILSNENCKLPANSSEESEDWLGDRYEEMKWHNFPLIEISKIKHSCR